MGQFTLKWVGQYGVILSDKKVFEEFTDNREVLSTIARRIKYVTENTILNSDLNKIQDSEEDEAMIVREGKVIYKLHKHIERNHNINKKKKDGYFKKNGKLDCEICGFDFFESYGELGKGFIECHHRIPLHEIKEESNTSLDDLALVCANCHRMLHRGLSTISIEELEIKLKH